MFVLGNLYAEEEKPKTYIKLDPVLPIICGRSSCQNPTPISEATIGGAYIGEEERTKVGERRNNKSIISRYDFTLTHLIYK